MKIRTVNHISRSWKRKVSVSMIEILISKTHKLQWQPTKVGARAEFKQLLLPKLQHAYFTVSSTWLGRVCKGLHLALTRRFSVRYCGLSVLDRRQLIHAKSGRPRCQTFSSVNWTANGKSNYVAQVSSYCLTLKMLERCPLAWRLCPGWQINHKRSAISFFALAINCDRSPVGIPVSIFVCVINDTDSEFRKTSIDRRDQSTERSAVISKSQLGLVATYKLQHGGSLGSCGRSDIWTKHCYRFTSYRNNFEHPLLLYTLKLRKGIPWYIVLHERYVWCWTICSFLLYKYKTRNTINSSSWVMAYGSGGCIACCFFKSISRRELNVLLYNPMVLVITFVITLSRCMARVKNTRAQWNSLFSESMQLKRRHYLTLLFRGKNLAIRANLNPDLNRKLHKII